MQPTNLQMSILKMQQQQHDIKCKENSEKIRVPDGIWTHRVYSSHESISSRESSSSHESGSSQVPIFFLLLFLSFYF